MSKRKGDFEQNDIVLEEIEVEDVSEEESSLEDTEINVVDVEVEEENITEALPVMNDLDYIAQFIETAVDNPSPERDNVHMDALMEKDSDEDSSKSDSDVKKDDNVDMAEEDDDSESDSDSSESENEVLSSARKEMKVWLTEEEEEGGLSAEVPPRTTHEVSPDEVESANPGGNLGPEFPQRLEDIQLLSKVGFVLSVVRSERTVVIQAYPTVTPLNESSVICDEDGTVLGGIFEVFGPVTTPFYMIKIREPKPVIKPQEKSSEVTEEIPSSPTPTDIPEINAITSEPTIPSITVWDKFPKGTIVCSAPTYATYITPTIMSSMKLKGSDASNAFDEEPPEEEQEYSDDEKEMLAKRLKKKSKQGIVGDTNPVSANALAGREVRQKLSMRRGKNVEPTIVPPNNYMMPTQPYPTAHPSFYPQPPVNPHYSVPYQTSPYPSSSTNQQTSSIFSSLQYPLPSTGTMSQPALSSPPLHNSNQMYYHQQPQQQQQMHFFHHQLQQQQQHFQPQTLHPQGSNSTSYTLVYSPQLGTYQYLPTTIQLPNTSITKPPEPPKPPAPNH